MSRSITGVHQLHWLTLYRGWISSRLLSYTNVYVDSAGLAPAYLADGEFHQSCRRRTQPRHSSLLPAQSQAPYRRRSPDIPVVADRTWIFRAMTSRHLVNLSTITAPLKTSIFAMSFPIPYICEAASQLLLIFWTL